MLIYHPVHTTFFHGNKSRNDVKKSANPNSKSSLLQLRASDNLAKGLRPLDPQKP
jgi:hypothetical protein